KKCVYVSFAFGNFTTLRYFNMYFFVISLSIIYLCCFRSSIQLFSFACAHYFLHPSSYVNQLSHSDSFSTILNIAVRDRLFSFISSSVGKIGFLVINLNGASKPSGIIGIPRGTGFCVVHFLNACLHILSSKE